MCNLQSNKVVVWQDESLAQVPAMNYDMNFPLSLKIKMQPYLTSSDIWTDLVFSVVLWASDLWLFFIPRTFALSIILYSRRTRIC